MKTLTQVWLWSAAGCFLILILGFNLADRIGLFVAFLLCLAFLYLTFYVGLKIFLNKTKSHEVLGSDTTQMTQYLNELKRLYGVKSIRFFTTPNRTPPLVWSEFSNELIITVNQRVVNNLTTAEKKILCHLLLSHGQHQSKMLRRVLGLLFMSLTPVEKIVSPFFNFTSYLLGLSKEIYTADLKALSQAQTSGHATQLEFGLFLHKLHYINQHKALLTQGTYYFSILSDKYSKLYNLNFHPHITKREKNILGYSI